MSVFHRAAPLLLISLLAAPAFAQAPSAGKKYAFLVGVNSYDHASLRALDFPENDVVELADLLRPAGFRVMLLSQTAGKADSKRLPTLANIESRLAELLRDCTRNDMVLVALAGHGHQFEKQKESDPDDAYFCPSDAKPLRERRDTLLSLQSLYRKLDESGAGVKLMLVDACRDDPIAGRGIAGMAPKPPRGVAALYSCSAGERAYESAKVKHGVFFHFVLEGFRGAAATEGEVTWDALQQYVRRRVSREVDTLVKGGVRQTPALVAGELAGEPPVLIDLRRLVEPELEPHRPSGATLGIGDDAPPLRPSEWLRGDPIGPFGDGKIYVLCFCQYCENCRRWMPSADALARQYAGRDVVFVAIGTKEKYKIDRASAVKYVAEFGPQFDFRFCYSADDKAWREYMDSAGNTEMPWAFVIRRDGKLAASVSATHLADVLPRVVARTWRGKSDFEAVNRANESLAAIMKRSETEPAAAVEALESFADAHPAKAATDEFALNRVRVLLRAGRAEDAKSMTEPLLKSLRARKDLDGLDALSLHWTNRETNPSRRYLALGLTAADAVLAIWGENNPVALYQAALAYIEADRFDRAIVLMEKAIPLTDDKGRTFLRVRIQQLKTK